MHDASLDPWRHGHVFLGAGHGRNERRTRLVVALTVAAMAAEVAAGIAFGSMALLADGFHMASHAGTLLVAALAYRYARRHARDERFTFGTGKFGDLAGFASAVALAGAALLIGWESAVRLLVAPVAVRFDEALAVAALGLAVNLASAWLLRDEHGHGEDGGHQHHHHDHNLRAAYLHVLADALTSVLAIAGLLAGRALGWTWTDPLVGVLGAAVIARWSWGLAREAGAVLLDAVPAGGLARAIREALEQREGDDGGHDLVSDLHLWRVGPGHLAAIVAVVTDRPRPPDHYKARLASLPGLSHVTVEVQPRRRPEGAAAAA